MTARFAKGRFRVLGTGMALPGPAITTEELLARLERNFGLSIRSATALARRFGVETRHHCRDWQQPFEGPRVGYRNPDLASLALVDALAQAQLPVGRLQFLFAHTATPARLLPPNVSEVANNLGLDAPYAEFRQACTGFANALQMADGLLGHATSAPVAIIGSETGSVFLDPYALVDEPEQWANVLQMGDGAGAVVLGPDEAGPGARLESMFFGHIGLGRAPGFTLDEGGSDHPNVREGRRSASFRIHADALGLEGTDLFKTAFAAARDAGVSMQDLAAIVPHQAHGHIGEWLARTLDVDERLIWGNGARLGNLGSASIWVALCELRASGMLAPGDRVLFLGAEITQFLYGGFVYVHG